MKIYKTMISPILLYGSETWIQTQKYINKIQTAEMKFLRSIKGCSILGKIKNWEIRKELANGSITNIITECRKQWKERLLWMEERRFLKFSIKLQPKREKRKEDDPGKSGEIFEAEMGNNS